MTDTSKIGHTRFLMRLECWWLNHINQKKICASRIGNHFSKKMVLKFAKHLRKSNTYVANTEIRS